MTWPDAFVAVAFCAAIVACVWIMAKYGGAPPSYPRPRYRVFTDRHPRWFWKTTTTTTTKPKDDA